MELRRIRHLEICLRGFLHGEDLVSEEQFIGALGARESAEVEEIEPSEHPFQCARLIFVAVKASEPALPETRLHEYVTGKLEAMAAWLGRRDRAIFESLRLAGLETDIYIDIGFEGDGYSRLSLPARLLLEAGRHGLGIESNAHDVSIDIE
jgi:hypothetical protein